MNDIRILIVEDDSSVSNLIATTLKIHGCEYMKATSGAQAIAAASSLNPQLILLDLGLPDMDGIEVIRSVRSWSSAMIIIISARHEDSDKITALDSGADDYLTKPFSVDELMARIRAAQRRMNWLAMQKEESAVFVNGSLKVDYAANVVSVNDVQVHLTNIEYRLLSLLSRNVGKVLTHSWIISRIWGNEMESDISSLRVYMTSLRKKLRQAGENDIIITHIGIGYQMIRR